MLTFLKKGDLMDAIKRDFGTFDNFKSKLVASSVAVQGSGWGWLVSESLLQIKCFYFIFTFTRRTTSLLKIMITDTCFCKK